MRRAISLSPAQITAMLEIYCLADPIRDGRTAGSCAGELERINLVVVETNNELRTVTLTEQGDAVVEHLLRPILLTVGAESIREEAGP